jgi:hydroxymethylpyrimidine pyrophosphatase-like HAD family hydrolase
MDQAPRALAADYDGTLAEAGCVSEATLAALRRLKDRGWRLLLVTGRHLEDLQAVFPALAVCDLVVAENGGLLFRPPDGPARNLAPPPPAALLAELDHRGVGYSAGRAVIATVRAHEAAVREALRAARSNLELNFNKDALMLLPPGVDKRSGLLAALAALELSPSQVVAVGDAENDLPFLAASGRGVAVANAVPALREAAALVTAGSAGEGVRELIERLLSDEPLPDEQSAP